MTSRTLLLASIVFVMTGIGFSCRSPGDDRWVTVGGSGERAHLLVIFKKGTSEKQIEEFYENVVNMETQPLSLRFRFNKGEFVGAGVNFSTQATPNDREGLKTQVKQSPIVYKVYENTIAKEIDDL